MAVIPECARGKTEGFQIFAGLTHGNYRNKARAFASYLVHMTGHHRGTHAEFFAHGEFEVRSGRKSVLKVEAKRITAELWGLSMTLLNAESGFWMSEGSARPAS